MRGVDCGDFNMKLLVGKMYIYDYNNHKIIFQIIDDNYAKILKVIQSSYPYTYGQVCYIRHTHALLWKELTPLEKVKYL